MDRTEALAEINAGNIDERRKDPPVRLRRLALCFDGTWNGLESQTNVSRLFRTIGSVASGCEDQLTFYDDGVGTRFGERLRGGVFGMGLERNILDGYCWLVNNYQCGPAAPDPDDPSDETFDRGDAIYLFGFSRGAFTARSLAGLINRVGIVDLAKAAGPPGIALTPQSPEIVKAWGLYHTAKEQDLTRDSDICREFRAKTAIAVKIAMIGVWDTVGSLGIPKFRAPLPLPFGDRYRFHDQTLGRVVESAYHAMAIDEQRVDYDVTLWKTPKKVWASEVEQRWFPGAHANVGGGYDGDLLCEPPLLWMAQKAALRGLRFNARGGCQAVAPREFSLDGSEYLTPVRDSYAEFMYGVYRIASPLIDGGRHIRRMMEEADGINQTIDPTAWLKWDADNGYRPSNLARAGRVLSQ